MFTQWLCVLFYKGKPLINMGSSKLLSSSVLVVYVHTVVGCVVLKGGTLINMGFSKLLSSSVLVVYVHTVVLYVVL